MQERQEMPTKTLKSFNALGPCANIFVSSNTGSWRLERPSIDFSRCNKCGICRMYCPAGLIDIYKDREECVTIMWDYCKGCGVCANECPRKCITMIEERGEI